MDRIAVIADVHGNLPALEAVLKDIEGRSVSQIICLGDTIGKGPNPDLAVDRVREVCAVVLRGNWEEGVLRPTGEVSAEFRRIIDWNVHKLGPDRCSYLGNTPLSCDLLISGRLVRLYHSSAQGIFHRVHPTRPLEDRLAMFENTELTGTSPEERTPDVVGYADIHSAYIQHFEGKTLFNAGSVGNPLEIPQASYAIIEGLADGTALTSFSINFVRVPYDVEKAIRLARDEVGMPGLAEYESELRTARYARKK